MTAFGDNLENALLEHIFRDTAYTQPTNVFIALFTGTVGDDFSGGANEVSGNGYGRATVNTTNSDWDAAANGTVANTASIEFPQATGIWGTISHVAVTDEGTSTLSANLLFHGSLNGNKEVGSADTFKFNAGAFTVSLD